MAYIPKAIQEQQPVLQGLDLRNRGKVRDSYNLPDDSEHMLVVASDRVSIFDFVLNMLIPLKGQILNAMSLFLTREVIDSIFETDLVADGSEIDLYLPQHLRNNPDLQARACIVKILPPTDVEDIARFIITGSVLEEYKATGSVSGQALPSGLLRDGDMLPFPMYTPSTKAAVGHDVNIKADDVVKRYGHLRERNTLQVAGLVHSYARERGIVFGDTKFEWSFVDGRWVLMDEKATPDSSRYMDEVAWAKALREGKPLPSLDKQFVREIGKKLGVQKDPTGRKRDPQNPEDLAFVEGLKFPDDVIAKTTRLYRYIFFRMTGMRLERYQRDDMNVFVDVSRPRIEIIIGSESDRPQIAAGLEWLRGKADVRVSIISCHRNPEVLDQFVQDGLSKADGIVAGAGSAAQLPGVLKSKLDQYGHSHIPVLGVAFKGKTAELDRDATGSIKGLPGQPVELDESGEAYFGSEGFKKACIAAVENEFLPKTFERKPATIGVEVFS